MDLFEFWAREHAEVEVAGVRRHLSALGWSHTGPEQARAMAKQRLQLAEQRFRSGQVQEGADYPYSDGRPLREEMLETLEGSDGSTLAVITRNNYGALVLNTSRVLFIDVDFVSVPDSRSLFGRWFGGKQSDEERGMAHVAAVAERYSQWGFAVYRTAAGLRVVLLSTLVDARDPVWVDVLEAFGSDPMYVKLCRSQLSFRARLTPKPWRCQAPRPPTRFPYESEWQQNAMRHWTEQYERVCQSYATCAPLATIGDSRTASDVRRVLALHDAHSVRASLPLA